MSRKRGLTSHEDTIDERLASEAFSAGAYRTVVDDLAARIQSAGSWAWVGALAVHAGLIRRAFGAGRALGTTSWWTADELGRARANSLIVHDSALTVRSAGRLAAGVLRFRHCCINGMTY